MSEQSILRATMTDRAVVWRQSAGPAGVSEAVVYRDLPCALSRAAQVRSPAAAGELDPMAESRFPLTLFLPPDTVFRPGDRAEVTRGNQIFCGALSASIPYVSHAVAVLQVTEVKTA